MRLTDLLTIATATVAIAICVIYYKFDPATITWAPKCPLKVMTGLDCPGCGSQRMLHALLHGNLHSAWEANALLLVMIPLMILMWWAEWQRLRYPRLHRMLYSTPVAVAIGVLLTAWWIWRNFI